MKTKAVFFDVDGTIIPLDVAIRTFQETCKHFKIRIPISRELLKVTIGYRLTGILHKVTPEALPFAGKFIKYFEDHQIENFKKYGGILPYVKSNFKSIKKRKIKIGIITTKKSKEAIAILKEYKLPYDVLVGNDNVKHIKPNSEPVLKACKELKVKPRECIFVGDHPFDMQAAKSAGCLAIGVLTGWGNRKNLKKAGADYIIKDLKSLIKLLK
ncbi:MAG: HAD-IA family hydrolase [Candidatus Aenigmarchaeota archaeon]|nr:HAD-IA family hydrolase [Candidatus Aenigmarchaeota archaeon]